MRTSILITSFLPWRAHQRSNSSDDLIAMVQAKGLMPSDAVWLRHVPVNFELAPMQVESEIRRCRPRAVICCGMAETRSRLSVERLAKHRLVLSTPMDTKRLVSNTLLSEISEDAGTYVCNYLYYSVLSLAKEVDWQMKGVFIHIPVLKPDNQSLLLRDFVSLIETVRRMEC